MVGHFTQPEADWNPLGKRNSNVRLFRRAGLSGGGCQIGEICFSWKIYSRRRKSAESHPVQDLQVEASHDVEVELAAESDLSN